VVIDFARLVVPFAVAGGGTAALVASMTRWVLLGPIAFGAFVGAALGAWLFGRVGASRDTRAPLRLTGVWLTVASAMFRTQATVPLVLSLVGCAIVFAVAVLDGFAESELAHLESAARLDAGASWWLNHVGSPRPAALDLERARRLLAASRRSRIAIVVVLVATTVVLIAYASCVRPGA